VKPLGGRTALAAWNGFNMENDNVDLDSSVAQL